MSGDPSKNSDGSSVPLRVGLLGASNIAKQVWAAIHETGSKVTFIGCRDLDKGTAYRDALVQELGIAAADAPEIGSYSACVSSENVDLVYISIPVTARDYWVMQCVEHNKHVVGEKPPAVDADMLRSWIEALDAKQLLYMDGTMFSHGARVKKVTEAVRSLGPVKHIFSNFSFCAPDSFMQGDIRIDPALEPHGALGDLGWYNIRFILHMMDFAMPAEVTGRVIKQNDKGAVIEFSGELTFRCPPDNEPCVASIFCAFDVASEQTVQIATTNGVVELHDFVHCAEGAPASWKIIHSKGSRGPTTNYTRVRNEEVFTTDEVTATQKYDMWRTIARILYRDTNEGGRLKAHAEESRFWATIAWKTQAVMDKMLESARQSTRA